MMCKGLLLLTSFTNLCCWTVLFPLNSLDSIWISYMAPQPPKHSTRSVDSMLSPYGFYTTLRAKNRSAWQLLWRLHMNILTLEQPISQSPDRCAFTWDIHNFERCGQRELLLEYGRDAGLSVRSWAQPSPHRAGHNDLRGQTPGRAAVSVPGRPCELSETLDMQVPLLHYCCDAPGERRSRCASRSVYKPTLWENVESV